MTKEKYITLVGAWETIKKHCKETKAEEPCPFSDREWECHGRSFCKLWNAVPTLWEKPEEFPAWTKTEQEIAKTIASVLPDAKSVTVRKVPGISSAVYFIDKTGIDVAKMPAAAFPSLEMEKFVKLSDIIGEG